MRLTGLILRVVDVDRSAEFYRALGLTLVAERHGDGPAHYSAQLGELLLELYPQRDEGTTSAARLILGVADVDRAWAEGATAGGRGVRAPQVIDGRKHAVIDDPDGHRIELEVLA